MFVGVLRHCWRASAFGRNNPAIPHPLGRLFSIESVRRAKLNRVGKIF